ncbi:MAG: hypothetical protein OEX19_12325 [Gammaproteobacteria bacterium]|nr:hypothetical protein [Gammaproteobacteria bacterium]
MNIIIDMVTGEIEDSNNITVISDRYTEDKPEKRENTDFLGSAQTELQIREIEYEAELPTTIPVDISSHDIDAFLNDMV